VGGAGSLLGPIIGAIVYYRVDQLSRELPDKEWLPSSLQDFLQGRPNLATLVFAALLILLMFVAPFGLVGLATRIGRRVVQIIPAVPGTPSARAVARPVEALSED
jgi:ABC-type branched-subunit amino acid transport system permease subunit